jgi:glycosyltransferase involved in cell wall biosynthesis
MPGEETTACRNEPAGRDLDVPALVARLQREIGRTGATAQRSRGRRPGMKGALAYSAKKLLVPALARYAEFVAYQQRFKNAAAARRGTQRRRRHSLRAARLPDHGPGVRVAYYSPMPPERSGIADYSAVLLPVLKRRLDVEVARRGKHVDADVALYHVGNDPEAHGWIVERLRRAPGVVVLHDFVLHHLVASMTLGRKNRAGYLAAMESDAGVAGRLLGLGVIDGCIPPLWEVRAEDFPLCGEVLELATGVIVHSHYVEQRVHERGYGRRVWRIPHPAWPAKDVAPERPSGEPVFGAFGNVNASKRVPQLLEAFARFRESRTTSRLVLVGAAAAGTEVKRSIDYYGLENAVVREGYVGEDRLWGLIAGVDAVISLRSPTMGETSGTALRALTLGKPLLVNDVGWFSELPDDVASKVTPGDGEVERLALAMETLSDPAVRERMGANARRLAAEEHDVERVAELYASALREAADSEGVVRALDEAQL